MRLAFFVNDVATEVDEYTTTRLALAAARAGHEIWYVGAGDIGYQPDGAIRAHARTAIAHDGDELAGFLERIKAPESNAEIALDEMDAVMLRNDSVEDLHERPWAFSAGTLFGRMLAEKGVCVVNDPYHLPRTASKIYLQEFSEDVRPRQLVSRNEEEIRSFIDDVGRTVVKPLYGAKGRNVFLIEGPDDANVSQMVEAVLKDGYAIVQERVAGAEDGDIRMFLVDGEPLQKEGRYAAFRRVPEGNDIRANISAGGHPREAQIDDKILNMVAAMTEQLRRDGMFFAGLDIIGAKVVEINVESAGGLQSAHHLTGVDFAPEIITALEARAERSAAIRSFPQPETERSLRSV